MKATIVFGEAATERYGDTGKIPSAGWLRNHGGKVMLKKFKTEAEFEAYVHGVKDCMGWNDYMIIKSEPASEVR